MNKGDIVKFLNEDLEGEIKKVISDSTLLIAATDGFDYEVAIHEIIVINKDNSHQYKVDDEEISTKIKSYNNSKSASSEKILDKYFKTTKFQFERVVEVDLHLEELVEFPQLLDDWQKLHTQIQHLKKCLNAALDENVKKIVFIHGVGTGVLKTEIRNYLSNYSNLTFKDADQREYGIGATEVLIR